MAWITIIGKILTLVGSLGLFLFGMKLMSEALQKVAGSKMRHILAAMTNSRIKGAFTGMLVTTTIQSSSATTVMVVSFVNAGLLSLVAAVGVIMGANIGTTVTAWLISLLGFKISLSFLSLPLIGISFPLFFSKNSLRKSWGEFIIGFAILFIGLQFLKESVPNIQSDPESLHFISSFTDLGFLSVLIFILIGTILTILIQSSSATMALTLVMCYNGLIPFEMAAAMVLGENIGTTVTANFAAMVANVSAKRAARAHLIFNLFGVIWMVAVFHYFLRGIDYFLQQKHGVSILNTHLTTKDFESIHSVYPVALAIFHTSFNIINTLLLIGFAAFIAKVATKMVPDKSEDDEEFTLKYISSGLFSTSELSIIQARKEVFIFGTRIEKMFELLESMMVEPKPKKYYKLLDKIKKYEEITDDLELEIASYLTNVSEGEISHESSKKIRAMLKIIDDLESIGDVIYAFSKTIDNTNQAKSRFTQEQKDRLNEMFELLKQAFTEMNLNLEKGFSDVNVDRAYFLENQINEKRDQLRLLHVEDLKEKRYKHKIGAFYSEMVSQSERIGDYIINVSEAIIEYQDTA
ncbi:MAG: Na/Pi cotransporter family protein [Bacteroidales bacterium]|nr:Na/Pi cotransporter family protein [Bacteroidota bacterium]MBL6949321.1 Na/Pi cotransporter family protein [Bacteroidales bacterium]